MGGTSSNRELREFVKHNINLLLSPAESKEELKQCKFHYFRDQLKSKFGMPKNTEIARELCVYLLETGAAGDLQQLIDRISKSWFLSKNIFDRDYPFFESIIREKPSQFHISSEDLRNMGRQEFIIKKQLEIVEQARPKIEEETKRAVSEIEEHKKLEYAKKEEALKLREDELAAKTGKWEKIESEIAVYDSVRIEDIPYSPAIEADSAPIGGSITWWSRLGLFQNPFPTVDGLSKISDKYYDRLVLKTPVFRKYLSDVVDNPEEFLNKTYLIVGEFGSGKTTLFDYLKKPMLTHDLFPIHIILDAMPDKEGIRRSFNRALLRGISDHYRNATGVDPRSIYQEVEREDLFEILKSFIDVRSLLGIVIMVDGLHKNESYLHEALGFIQILQNTKDFWIREGINVTFMIAGTKEWDRELRANSAVKGSINHIDSIPSITAQEAYEMLSMRLSTFSTDQKRPAKIRAGAVYGAHQILSSGYSRDITFRDIAEEIIPHLEQTDLGFVEISIPFDKELLSRLKKDIELFPSLHKKITALRQRSDTFLPSAQLLAFVLERKRISERDMIFRQNRELFAILYKVGLVQKGRDPKTGRISWVPSRDLLDYSSEVESEVHLIPSRFLVDILKPEARPESIQVESEEERMASRIVSSNRTIYKALVTELESAIQTFKEVNRHSRSPTDLVPCKDICGKTSGGIVSILKCLSLVVEPRDVLVFGGRDSESWLSDSWIGPQEVFEFWKEIKDCGDNILDRSRSSEIARAYLRAFRVVLNHIDQMLKADTVAHLTSHNLRRQDKVALNPARLKFLAGDYFSATRDLTDYVEQRLRDFLIDFLTLKYGSKWNTRLSQELNKYIHDQKSRSTTILPAVSPSLNDLYCLTRQHYRMIVTENEQNWTQMFQACFAPETKDFVNGTLHLLFSFSDKDKHNLDNEYFRENSDKLLQAFQSTVRLIACMNLAYLRLLTKDNIFLKSRDDEVQIYFSFLGLADVDHLAPSWVSPATKAHILAVLKDRPQNSNLTVDVAERESIEFMFGRKYKEAVPALAELIAENIVKIVPIGGSSVEVRML